MSVFNLLVHRIMMKGTQFSQCWIAEMQVYLHPFGEEILISAEANETAGCLQYINPSLSKFFLRDIDNKSELMVALKLHGDIE